MSFWTAIVIIVAIIAFTTIYRLRLKANTEEVDGVVQNLIERLDSIEERIANLETIVLENEKNKDFSQL